MTERLNRRVQFLDCAFERIGDGTLRAKVSLQDGDRGTFTGRAEASMKDAGDLWSAAAATVDALRSVFGFDEERLRLKDVVAFDLSDELAVAVELRAIEEGHKRRLMGLCQSEEDRGRAAACSVLSATNRFFRDG